MPPRAGATDHPHDHLRGVQQGRSRGAWRLPGLREEIPDCRATGRDDLARVSIGSEQVPARSALGIEVNDEDALLPRRVGGGHSYVRVDLHPAPRHDQRDRLRHHVTHGYPTRTRMSRKHRQGPQGEGEQEREACGGI